MLLAVSWVLRIPQVLVFDEADKLFDMGFIEQARVSSNGILTDFFQVDQVISGCTNKAMQQVLFSATLGQVLLSIPHSCSDLTTGR